MRKFMPGILSLLFVLALVSFMPIRKSVTVYFIYLEGDQSDRSSYAQQTMYPDTYLGDNVLAWIMIVDNDGVVTDAEFSNWFGLYDENNNNTLDDDEEHNGLEKKIW